METKTETSKTTYRTFLIVGMSTAILLVSPVLALLLIGYLADAFFHTTPLYMCIGLGIGFVSGIMNVFKMIQVFQKKKLANNK